MKFWEVKQETKISPISYYLDWKSDKKTIDKIKFIKESLADTTITPEDKALYEKQLTNLESEKLWHFVWWNKQTESEIKVIPTEFILLDETSCVKWRDKTNNCAIYSNEIKYFNEVITAKSFKGWEVYSWLYNPETKLEFKNRWLKFTKWLIVQEGDVMVEYYINWTAINLWIDDTKGINNNEYKIAFDKMEEKTNWDITYYVPRWKQWAKITDEERTIAMANMELLEDYFRKDA